MKTSVGFFIILIFALTSFGQDKSIIHSDTLANCSLKINDVCQEPLFNPSQIQINNQKFSFRAERLIITNNSKMAVFLKSINICNRVAYSYGNANCDSVSASMIELFFQASVEGNSGLTTIHVGTELNSSILPYFESLDISQNTSSLLQLEMPIWPINKSAGFEARNYTNLSTDGRRNLISIQVPNGNTLGSGFEFNLLFNEEKIAEGSMVNCSTLNCGL